jgi:indolepyruvate ferredoxin oxidoreductase
MTLKTVSLSDRFDISRRHVLLNGTQALVRVVLMQKARDRAAGLSTGGYVTGYRGSPLGAVDMQMSRAGSLLAAADIRFEPGINEDLAATALWGSQQVALRGEGRVEGVFGLWYGKGPGVDRSGDAFRHANMAGSAEKGGVIVCMGDDHTGESSTVLHQSEFALVDAMMPILSPAGVQEVMDHALTGWSLSRFSGCWVGVKCVKDTVEVTEVVDGDPHRLSFALPEDVAVPPGGLNIRLGDPPSVQEARLHDFKLEAARAFARTNRLDRRVWGAPGARIGIVSSGKSWLDTIHALHLLGLDPKSAEALGISTYKVAMVWPLDTESLKAWARDLELIVVVEEKRKLIEPQIKEALYDVADRPRVVGGHDAQGEVLFPTKAALDPVTVARKLGDLIAGEGVVTDALTARRRMLREAARADNAEDIAVRTPYFCAGCPHNSSTVVPSGSRAYAGIGCHYMAQWMDRATVGYTHMGAEGANWIGEAPFSTRNHVFQNIGDGTYNHSGVQAIRAALAADVNITYKILFNDAVAMTGGQKNDGGLTPQRIARELLAMGVVQVSVVFDPNEPLDLQAFPKQAVLRPREDLDAVQTALRNVPGVSALVYVQTCAAEKRRRRKRGAFPDPGRRVFINPEVCEGCGDCGVQSNCVAILPLETPLGRKREIDQSSCNRDFSCLKGFCPSFVSVEGGTVRTPAPAEFVLPDLPAPALPEIRGTFNVVITGVGGTGVVTVGAVLAMAAHLEGKGAGVMEMAGLAQKGGAVHIHCRLAERPEDITAIRVATAEADALIGGDLVVSAGARTLGLTARGRTRAILNSHEIITGAFTRDREFSLPTDRLELALRARLGAGALTVVDATRLAERLLGDAIYANVLLLGAAWQAGSIPLGEDALLRAIVLNGAGVAGNTRAFAIGRWAVVCPEQAGRATGGAARAPEEFSALVARRADHLAAYQDAALAERYCSRVEAAASLDRGFGLAVAQGYHKLLAYKDEYEVARLHVQHLGPLLAERFEGVRAVRFHFAAPFLARKGKDGRPEKKEYGPRTIHLLRLLARLKGLRGSRFDPFGRSEERRLERALISEYEADLDHLMAAFSSDNRASAIERARLPLDIRGFGPVKMAAAREAASRRAALMAAFDRAGSPQAHAAE